jgi:predicted lactoylglutathione lyase
MSVVPKPTLPVSDDNVALSLFEKIGGHTFGTLGADNQSCFTITHSIFASLAETLSMFAVENSVRFNL